VRNVFWLADSLQCMHSERPLRTCFSLAKIRHVNVDYASIPVIIEESFVSRKHWLMPIGQPVPELPVTDV